MSPSKIGFWTLTAIVAGNLVGSGVFLLPSSLAPYGGIALAGWGVTTVGALLLSCVFGYLSSIYPQTGGPYVYARAAFGDRAGFFVCWGYWVLSWISNPALAIGAVGYLQTVTGPLSPLLVFTLEAAIVVSVTAINLFGVRLVGAIEIVLTVLKIIPLLCLPIIGIFYLDFADLRFNLGNTPPDFWMSLNSAAFLTVWAFVGLETGTVPAGDIHNPSRIVGRATVAGTLIAALIYIVGSTLILGAVPKAALLASSSPYAAAGAALFGGEWGGAVAIIAVIACIGSLNGWTLIVGRIPFGAAKDGLFPPIFTKTTPSGTPYVGVLIGGACSFPLLFLSLQKTLLEQFHFILDVAVTLILIIYLISVLAFFVIAHRRGDLKPRRILLGTFALIFAIWALWATTASFILSSCLIFGLGIPVWVWMKKTMPL